MCSQPLFLSSSMVLQKAMSSLKEAYGKVILCLLCFFVIVAEGLGGMLKKANHMGLIQWFTIEISPMEVTHLQFTDDILIFL